VTTTVRVSLLEGGALRRGDAALIEDWRAGSEGRLWVDIQDPDHASLEPLLEGRFGFHELAAEDSLSENTLPKYDPFAEYDFFVFRAVDLNIHEHGSCTYKLSAFLGRDFLFTIHAGTMAPVDNVYNRLASDKRVLANGPDFLLYSIVDQMVDAHFPLLDSIEEVVDELQDAIFKNAQPSHLDELMHLKRDINVLRRQSMPQRELLNQISRGDAQFIQRQHLIYFRDVYDHMFRISETIDVERDMMAGTMEAYLSVIANRTNEIMRVLTVLSTVLMPMTVIGGIYGMNFDHIPELHWLHGYPFALGLMAVSAATMLLWFRSKGWIARPAEEPQRSKRRKRL